MTSFGYRLNPRYAIKECSSCGALYTRDCCCLKGNIEDKILVPKLPKNYARCGHPVDGPYCQGCALLRQELEENLVTHSQDFQNTFESSNDSTNVVNAPREPFVVKQDHESFIDNIIFDLNKAPDSPYLHTISPNQFHCFHCKDVLGDGEVCQRCTYTRCGSGLSKGLCYICGNNQNSLNDSLSISKNSSQSPPHINHHCCYECGDPLDGIFCKRCTCKSCGKDAHIGYNYPPKVLVISNPEPCKNQTIDELPQTLPSFHPTFHSGDESPFTCDSNPNYVDESPNLNITLTKLMEQATSFTLFCEMACQIVQKKQEEKRIEEEQAAKAQNWKLPICYDDDDDEERSNSLKDNIISELPPCAAITPNEPVDSLSMGDEHLNTISVTKSDEFIKFSVENLVPIPSDPEGESKCDVPACEAFTTFSNILFDADYDFYSVDYQSFFDEDLPKEKFYSNPLFDEEIIPMKIDPHPFNAESDLIESMLNHDSSIIISSKIDSFLDEFAGELTLLKLIPPGIDETDCSPEEETHFTKGFLYDNSSSRPPEEFVSVNFDAEIESFSPSPILVKDSDSLMEEIDLSFTLDYPMPSGIEYDDYDFERDILILKDLPSIDTLLLLEIESFHFDIPSFSRPHAKPPYGNTGILNVKMMGDISDQKVPMHKLIITLALHQEKSPDLLSHRGLKTFLLSAKCPMMIHGKNIPILDVSLFHFYPLDQFKYGGILSSSST
nr:hypothetical protein [Tanacetum cinerariifolium]